jgi:hypothetical protein
MHLLGTRSPPREWPPLTVGCRPPRGLQTRPLASAKGSPGIGCAQQRARSCAPVLYPAAGFAFGDPDVGGFRVGHRPRTALLNDSWLLGSSSDDRRPRREDPRHPVRVGRIQLRHRQRPLSEKARFPSTWNAKQACARSDCNRLPDPVRHPFPPHPVCRRRSSCGPRPRAAGRPDPGRTAAC